jgi:hypothetical protein
MVNRSIGRRRRGCDREDSARGTTNLGSANANNNSPLTATAAGPRHRQTQAGGTAPDAAVDLLD